MPTALLATQVPTPIATTAPLIGQPVTPFTTGQTYPPPGTSSIFNQVAAAMMAIGQCGCGGYGILNASGPAGAAGGILTSAGGKNVQVGLGVFLVDGLLELVAAAPLGSAPFYQVLQPAPYTLTDNQLNFVWLTQTGSVVAATTRPYPAQAKDYLGAVTVAAGVITGVDTTGVMYVSGGVLWRQTADIGPPLDAPAASLRFYTVTLGGTYFWDGTAHRAMGILPLSKIMRTGSLAETCSRELVAGDSGAILTSGQLYMVAINIDRPTTVSTITFMSGTTALAGTTHSWAALYDGSRNLLSQSTDNVALAWAANSEKAFALAVAQNLQPGLYYVGLMLAGAGMPSLMSAALNALVTAFAPILCGTADGGLTTTAPNPAAAITATAKLPYAWLS